MNLQMEIHEDLLKRFEMALQLTGEEKNTVMESLIKAYVVQTFAQTASAYQNEIGGDGVQTHVAKAVHKIPKWASKPMVIPSKIIRAYLRLLEINGSVSYAELMQRCSDKENYPDEYVATFANNFAQMKFDDAKSHGKVFEVNSEQKVVLWKHVEEIVMLHQDKFKNYSTAVGYINKNNQKNCGKTQLPGTDHGQWLYRMRCEHCLHEYYANGSDIHLKKCPACQGGADTGA